MITTDNTLHIWKIPLDISELELPHLFTQLSDEEKKSAQRFRFDKHRRRYIAAHAAMRNILAQHLNLSAQHLDIQTHEHGKPFILNSTLHFNLSHAEELALLVVSHQGDVGIDIEHIKHDIDILGIAKRFFHPSEFQQLQQTPSEKQLRHFYYCWTGKEAYLKAKGLGIANHLQQFSLDFHDPQQIHIIFAAPEFEDIKEWSVFTFQPDPHYISTIVSSKKPTALSFHDFPSFL